MRLRPIAIIADIEKAFLQISLREPDRDLTRFLWYKDDSTPIIEGNIQTMRFTRVPFGVTCSPFILGIVLKHVARQCQDVGEQLIDDSMYVDNLVTSVSTQAQGEQLYFACKKMMTDVSMNLREWQSNCTGLMSAIPESDHCKDTVNMVLGLKWDSGSDTLSLKDVEFDSAAPLTKRRLLSAVMGAFDPVGWGIPATLIGKLALQQEFLKKRDWDSPLTDRATKDTWAPIIEELGQLSRVCLKRPLCFNDLEPFELHTFTDASKHAYATATYLRQKDLNTGKFITQLIYAKCRVAPAKQKITIPRMELLGIVIGTRGTKYVLKELRLTPTKIILWTDSECCLKWLTSTKQLTVFVANRVRQIQLLQSEVGIEFRHIKGTENPADVATRGETVDELMEDSLWWNGPSWMENEDWPEGKMQPITEELRIQIEAEHLKNQQPVVLTATAVRELPEYNFF
jgi:hypothetical protein